MMKKEEKKEGMVRDLAERVKRGELTPKEAKKKLNERGLMPQESWTWRVSGLIIYAMYFIFWLPLNFKLSAQLPAISFPAIVIYISLILLAIGTFFMLWVDYSHRKKGGLKESGDTIIFYREGLYSVMRHPGGFGFMMWFICLPFIISAHVPFTFLSAAAIFIAIVYHYYGMYVEEKTNIMKWGDEYRQYMKEVPRFNFILGICRWAKRKRK